MLCRLAACLGEATRLLRNTPDRFSAGDRDVLRLVVAQRVDDLDLDAAAELIDSVDRVLLRVGDNYILESWFRVEHYRDKHRDHMETPFVTWSDLFGTPPHPDGDDRGASADSTLDYERVRCQLLAIRETRSREYRLHRARLAMRNRTLMRFAPVLALLVVSMVVVLRAFDDGPQWQTVALVAASGAVGGTLSGMFKLRDQVDRIADIRALAWAPVVQPLIGAATGLVMLLVLISGFLPDEGRDTETWAKYGIIGFVAGFSEPFFLGVVGKIAGTAGTEAAAHPSIPGR